jgi:WD40 repeat protein
VRVWDAITGAECGVLRSPDRRIGEIAFSPDGKTLAVASGAMIRLWELSTRRVVFQLPMGAASVLFSPDGGTLVTGSHDGTIHCWDAGTGRELRRWRGSGGAMITSLAISVDGSQLVSGDSDGLIRLWDAATGEPRFRRIGHATAVRSVALSPGGKMLVSAGDDRSLRLWDVAACREIFTRSLPCPGGGGFGDGFDRPHSVAFAPDGKTVAA